MVAVLQPAHHVVVVVVAGHCVGSVGVGSDEQTLDVSDLKRAVWVGRKQLTLRITHLMTVWQTVKKICILFFSHSRHIGKIPKFKIQYPELKFEFKSEKICCCMGPY